ncbi:MAG: hypothetical protein IBX63_12175 [Coriobacteriia bacterium]|nr:hypothetical protein [Coriobacteriia bacterium]
MSRGTIVAALLAAALAVAGCTVDGERAQLRYHRASLDGKPFPDSWLPTDESGVIHLTGVDLGSSRVDWEIGRWFSLGAAIEFAVRDEDIDLPFWHIVWVRYPVLRNEGDVECPRPVRITASIKRGSDMLHGRRLTPIDRDTNEEALDYPTHEQLLALRNANESPRPSEAVKPTDGAWLVTEGSRIRGGNIRIETAGDAWGPGSEVTAHVRLYLRDSVGALAVLHRLDVFADEETRVVIGGEEHRLADRPFRDAEGDVELEVGDEYIRLAEVRLTKEFNDPVSPWD